MTNIRALNGAIQVREAGKGKVRIAGYANRFGKVDTYGTRFDPKSVRLERFKQNPVLLFNHDVNMPVGKVISVETRDDGVWVDAELSASTAPQVAYVRDLVQEGCLKAFSMRFGEDAKMEKDPSTPGAMLVKDWEMQEVSIVSLPAQSESLFSLRMAQAAFRNVHNAKEAKMALSNVRGAKAAAYVNECITKASTEVERDDVLERLRDRSGLEAGALAQVIDGDVTPMPDAFVSAAVEVLGCDKDRLAELNAEDVEANKEGGESPAAVEPDPVRSSEVSTPVTSEMPNDNAMLQKLDSMVSLLGALVNEVKNMKEEMGKLMAPPAKREEVEIEIKAEGEEKPEEEPEEMDPETARKIDAIWARVEERARSMGL
jgi:HK97 family phage prohead protease